MTAQETRMRDLTRYALAAAARGWHVFPLAPHDKRPLPGFTAWETHATTDPALIHDMWTRGPFNIGIACGPSNLVVLDLDVPKPDEHPPAAWARPGVNDGSDVLAVLCEKAGQPLPLETFMVRTRRGGIHLYFTAPTDRDLRNTAGKLGWKIDTRARGGYVVAPGSTVTLPDGTGSYDVLHDPPPAPLPSWLADHLTTQPSVSSAGAVLNACGGDRAAGYALAALRGEIQRVLDAVPGTRNTMLNLAAFALGQLIAAGLLPRALAEACLLNAAEATGLDLREAFTTIRSGLDSGHRRPRRTAA
ncbi:bifunctional DNA primase/polymerase-like protein [Nonomuraea fuscirosea]|uniref:Bifunctional DNA primase/polymerase-like protein n=1 Tax=Nonomuraea fuscirosea TaxID=1291556 RepID=A0A2T0MSH1_9ACTN|nr:bifunctional DNA primase/polymerase [Nonomuraea fuscirosea]PRX61427.1 bifunctional DNA primase/polymerase-like protein [Nonomuraea fuscirosea]